MAEFLKLEGQSDLADLAMVFGGDNLSRIFEAANFVSQSDFYKALSALRPVLKHEATLMAFTAAREAEAGPPAVAAE